MSIIVRYNFSTSDESSLYSLDYEIFKNNFTDRWLQALQCELDCKRPMQQDGFYGSCFIDEAQIRLEMQRCIDTINAPSSGGPWFKRTLHSNMNQEYLMEIHEEFEILAEDPIFMSPGKLPRKGAIIYLNKLIHKYEIICNQNSDYHIDALFTNPMSWRFEDKDYRLFEIDLNCGGVYLDYGITGVPTLSAFFNNVKQRPVPQYNFKAGVKLIFFNSLHDDQFRNELKRWLAEKWQMNIEDSKTAIGLIPLGNLLEN